MRGNGGFRNIDQAEGEAVMGWGAAYALAEETGGALGGPDEVYEMLYGRDENKPPRRKHKCKSCGKKMRTQKGLSDHMRDKHGPETSND